MGGRLWRWGVDTARRLTLKTSRRVSPTPNAQSLRPRDAPASERCNQCGGTLVLAPSDYGLAPLLVCDDCGREVPAGAMAAASTTAREQGAHAVRPIHARKQEEHDVR